MSRPDDKAEQLQPPLDDFDEIPEWTEEDFARARPFKEAHPEFYAAWSEEVERHIDTLFALLQRQLDQSPDEWPASFTFPKPESGTQHIAFERFTAKLKEAQIPVEPFELS